MTCIVALVQDGKIYMGADSAGVAGYSLMVRRDPKIYRVDNKMLIGFTSSFRMGQLLGYALVLPEHHSDVHIERYMATSFIDAVRTCLKTGGYAKRENEVESGGTFLVGYRSELFLIDSDFQIGKSAHPYGAVGCGADLALGALHATVMGALGPQERLQAALTAAEEFSAGVRRPFMIMEQT